MAQFGHFVLNVTQAERSRNSMLIGREKHVLISALNEEYSQFTAVYGRRRVGKTFLIREVFDYQFDFQYNLIKPLRNLAKKNH